MTIDVAITIDVEFSAGGAFERADAQPIGERNVDCPVDGESAGLGFILDTLDAHRLPGVFFVETLQSFHFGDEPMARIARKIQRRGHDVQLHAHPCWLAFRDAGPQALTRTRAPCDSFAELADDAIDDALRASVAAFRRLGIGEPVAFRAGNLAVDARIYRRLPAFGIELASNIGVGVHAPAASLFLTGGRHRIGDCIEIPVASYPDVDMAPIRRWKTFTIAGTGGREARQWLESALRGGIGPLVVLTHPAEFVRGAVHANDPLRRNDTTRRRFADLCRFLADHPDDYRVVTFAGALAGWRREPATGNPRWGASPWARILRVAENRSFERKRAA